MLQWTGEAGAWKFPDIVRDHVMRLVEPHQAAVFPAVAGILPVDAFLSAILTVTMGLAEGVGDSKGKAAREALVDLHLQAVIERLAEAIDVADVAECLNPEVRRGRIVELLIRPAGLEVVFDDGSGE